MDDRHKSSYSSLKLLSYTPILFILFSIIGVVFTYIGHEIYYNNRQNDTSFKPEARLDLNKTGTDNSRIKEHGDSRTFLRVAIAPVVSPEKTLETYQEFVHYLSEKLGREPIFLRRQSYSEVNNLVRFQICDVAMVCDYAYIIGEQEFGMKILAVPQIKGEVIYYSFIIVHRNSLATSLLDLANKRFASADVMSASGWLFPMTWLKEHGQDQRNFFSEHLITGSHDRSIYAVTSKLVDAAAVDSLVYQSLIKEDPAIGEATKVIQKSYPLGMPPLVVPAQIDPILKRQLLTVLLEMHDDYSGAKILSSLNIERFVVPEMALYDNVIRAAKYLEE